MMPQRSIDHVDSEKCDSSCVHIHPKVFKHKNSDILCFIQTPVECNTLLDLMVLLKLPVISANAGLFPR